MTGRHRHPRHPGRPLGSPAGSPAGRPARRPGPGLIRRANRLINRAEVAQLRRTGRSALSALYRTPALVLETTGRHTGRRRATPLAHHQAPDGTIMVVGGAAGMTRTPDWVTNLRARPEATVVLDRRRIEVVARELTGPERETAWVELAARWPRIVGYERRARRVVPVFGLRRVGSPEPGTDTPPGRQGELADSWARPGPRQARTRTDQEPRSMPARDHLAIALDTPELAEALSIARAVQPHVAVAKVGLQLFSAAGHEAVHAMRALGMEVFLDLKLHDIPNTVRGAAEVLGGLGARYLTVHAGGGEAMIRAAIEGLTIAAAAAGLPTPTVLAVTVLTSDTNAPASLLLERLDAAVAADCPGVVCAATDLATIRGRAPHILTMVPGIRPAGAATHDQARVATPADAISAGADVLVIGRAVTHAADRAAAAAAIEAEVAATLAARP